LEEKEVNLSQKILRIIVIIFITLFGLTFMGCGTYYATDVIYLDEYENEEDITSIFTNYNTSIIHLEFRPFRPRFHFGYNSYGYWNTRPLWLDFDFYNGNLYSYHYPYYSYFYRPWNYWDYYLGWHNWGYSYMDPWYQGPFNNTTYNVIYNASRRGSLTPNRNIANAITNNRIENSNNRPVINNNRPIINVKPINNKPVNNRPNNTIIIKPNNNRPNNNYRPSNNNYKPNNNNSRPTYNNNSRPTNNSSKPLNNSRSTKGPR
jgi:hypothetical protein